MTRLVQRATRDAHDREALRGRLAVRVLSHRVGEYREEPAPVEGLVVKSESHSEIARFHSASGLYGFLDLPPGPQILRVVDPANRYLPLRGRVDVPELGASSTELLPAMEFELLPAIGFSFTTQDTVLWGQVRAGEIPAPLARVEVEVVGRRYVTHADFDGVYVVWLRDLGVLESPPGELDASLRYDRFVRPIPESDPVVAIPVDFRDLAPEVPLPFGEYYASLGPRTIVAIEWGRRTRFPEKPIPNHGD